MARWVQRLPNSPGMMWHRVKTSRRTPCGENLYGITTATVRDRVRDLPPAGARVCRTCRNVGPDGTVAGAYSIPRAVADRCWPDDVRPDPVVVFLEEMALWAFALFLAEVLDDMVTMGRDTNVATAATTEAYTDQRPEPFIPFQVGTLDALESRIRPLQPEELNVLRFGTFQDGTPADLVWYTDPDGRRDA